MYSQGTCYDQPLGTYTLRAVPELGVLLEASVAGLRMQG